MNTAVADQDSFKRAIINVASIGLSLNPIKKLAYLIPRGKKVVLDVSYRGLTQLAVEAGAIKWASADVVCANDTYEFQGMNREPVHKYNPFQTVEQRGGIIGGYCLAKTHDGEFILTQMNNDEIWAIRDRSESFKSGKNSPWTSDTLEMIKKTLIRRASKSWPMVDTREGARFEKAIDVTNDFDPNAKTEVLPQISHNADSVSEALSILNELGRTVEKYLVHASIKFRREIKNIGDLTDVEIDQALIELRSILEKEKKKQKEGQSENAS